MTQNHSSKDGDGFDVRSVAPELERALVAALVDARADGNIKILQRCVARLYAYASLLETIADLSIDIASSIETAEDSEASQAAIDYAGRLAASLVLARCAAIPPLRRYLDATTVEGETEAPLRVLDVNELATVCAPFGMDRDSVRLLFVLASNLILAGASANETLGNEISAFWSREDSGLDSLYRRMEEVLPDLATRPEALAQGLLDAFARAS